jgi:hypothetical protein
VLSYLAPRLSWPPLLICKTAAEGHQAAQTHRSKAVRVASKVSGVQFRPVLQLLQLP